MQPGHGYSWTDVVMYALTLVGPVLTVAVAYLVARMETKIQTLHDCLDQYHASNVSRFNSVLDNQQTIAKSQGVELNEQPPK